MFWVFYNLSLTCRSKIHWNWWLKCGTFRATQVSSYRVKFTLYASPVGPKFIGIGGCS